MNDDIKQYLLGTEACQFEAAKIVDELDRICKNIMIGCGMPVDKQKMVLKKFQRLQLVSRDGGIMIHKALRRHKIEEKMEGR